MNVIELDEKFYKEAIKLSEYAFQYKVPEEKISERLETMKSYHKLFGIVDQELVAKLHLLPFEIYLQDNKLKMGGIAGVATYPEFRRKGYVKEMLTHVLTIMKEDNCTVSMLHPFSISFYRKYGWEILSNRIKCTLTSSDLIMRQDVPGNVKRKCTEDAFHDISEIYEQYALRFSGMLVRTKDWWLKNVIDDSNLAIYYNHENQPNGYILYSIKDKKMNIEEFVALNGEARNGLWNFICQHDSMINELVITTNEQDPLLYSLHNPAIKIERSPYFMVRIIDVEKFLKQYTFNWTAGPQELRLKVADPYATWNEKTFILKDQKVAITENNSNDHNCVSVSINALSTMLFGYKRPMELYDIGHIIGTVEEIQKLERLVPQQQSFFNDFF
ncbi:GNAT family N-acetyltransferase [Litchfieldia salsa]|uniref:Predicted acetyltransferase n=1 Tax=Litchfieldia salsa TaxID=930152 RepID=A0A1H0TA28_9BACI|nr:GNAT family N-acetyltransferase [Litchfieldia salsa]SDP50903.1 Predicted acetyltransferase [Litchfieldia salsa]